MTLDCPRRLAHVMHVSETGNAVLCLMPLPDGSPVILQGVAALIWLAASEGRDVVPVVADQVGLPPEQIEEVTLSFIDDLVRRGLLSSGELPSPAALDASV